MAVSPVSINTALDQQSKTDAASSKLATDFNQFLILLTTQLQHQDPLNPMDTAEFTNQLVAFSGVEQQINTNQKLDSLVSLGLGSALGSAQSYIGKEVSYVSSEFTHTGTPSKIRYSIADNAVSSKISIYDESGKVVYSSEAAKTAGVHEFIWDGTLSAGGKAGPGTYEVKIDALDINDEAIDATSVVSGMVRGTETQNGQIYLLVGDRAVALSNVLNTGQNANSNSNDGLTMALNYVGLDVKYEDESILYSGSGPVSIDYSLDDKAVESQVIIKDDEGNIVYTAAAAKTAGAHTLSWNGRFSDGTVAPAGEYTITIDSIDALDARVGTQVIGSGRVTGVEQKSGELFLVVDNGAESIPLINILSANVPEEA
jgi:flagellar basal-body rod modification protein FlgD